MYSMNPVQANPMGGDIKTLCQRYMNYHVIAQTRDGSQFEGIIDGMDDDGVTMLVPEEVDGEERENDNKQTTIWSKKVSQISSAAFSIFSFCYFHSSHLIHTTTLPYYPYYPGYGYGGGY